MRSRDIRLFVLCVFSSIAVDVSQADEPSRILNLTVSTEAHSLDASWDCLDTDDLADPLETYRVRMFPSDQPERKLVQWVPASKESCRHLVTFDCLKPAISYSVQVIAYTLNGTAKTGEKSDVKIISTKSEPGFLKKSVEHWQYVVLGAGLTAPLMLILTSFVWCLCRKRCRGRRDSALLDDGESDAAGSRGKTKKSRKTKATLPSAKDLYERETAASPDRYSMDPVQGTGYRPMASPTTSRSHLVGTTLSSSSSEPRPPAMLPPEMETYQNVSTLSHNPVYDNCQY